MTNPIAIREIALGALVEILEKDSYSHLVMNQILSNYQYLTKQERSFLTRLCEGTVERKIQIDYIINQYSKINVDKMKPIIREILRMGVYQILFMGSVPDSAACNESVKLAQKKGFHNLKGFVNGILRNISRNKESVNYPSKENHPIAYFSVFYSMPEWIITKWMDEFDLNTVEQILMAAVMERPTTLRCNLDRITTSDLKERLKNHNITVDNGRYLAHSLKISDYDYLSQIKEFQEGLFQIQDESSMLAVEAAGIKNGDIIIDVCSAPGGKSLYAAEKTGIDGVVYARDLTSSKVSLIEENAKRLGVKNLITEVMDARAKDPESICKADVLLADLPCSGLGVIGRKSDIKYKMTQEKQNSLIELQREILTNVQSYVKPGGTLIYSTCTINSKENIENVRWFIKEYPFELDSMEGLLPETLESNSISDGYLQLIPGVHDTDGFFIARLKRKEINGKN